MKYKITISVAALLILAGCGGSSKESSSINNTKSVRVVDGYVIGAKVYDTANQNCSGMTDETGRAVLNCQPKTWIEARGGKIDIDLDGKGDIESIAMHSPANYDVITPLTELIFAGVDKKKLEQVLDINESDLNIDPVAANNSDLLKVFAIAYQTIKAGGKEKLVDNINSYNPNEQSKLLPNLGINLDIFASLAKESIIYSDSDTQTKTKSLNIIDSIVKLKDSNVDLISKKIKDIIEKPQVASSAQEGVSNTVASSSGQTANTPASISNSSSTQTSSSSTQTSSSTYTPSYSSGNGGSLLPDFSQTTTNTTTSTTTAANNNKNSLLPDFDVEGLIDYIYIKNFQMGQIDIKQNGITKIDSNVKKELKADILKESIVDDKRIKIGFEFNDINVTFNSVIARADASFATDSETNMSVSCNGFIYKDSNVSGIFKTKSKALDIDLVRFAEAINSKGKCLNSSDINLTSSDINFTMVLDGVTIYNYPTDLIKADKADGNRAIGSKIFTEFKNVSNLEPYSLKIETNATTFNTGDYVNIKFSAKDVDDENLSYIVWLNNETNNSGWFEVNETNASPYEYNYKTLYQGKYKARLTAKDSVNEVNSSDISFKVESMLYLGDTLAIYSKNDSNATADVNLTGISSEILPSPVHMHFDPLYNEANETNITTINLNFNNKTVAKAMVNKKYDKKYMQFKMYDIVKNVFIDATKDEINASF